MDTKNKHYKGDVISLHVGQAGCNLGSACWEMYCLEHGIKPDGTIFCHSDQSYPEHFFTGTRSDKMVPKASFIDLEPLTIDEIRKGRFRKLFNPHLLISGKEDAAGCFARGYHTLAKDVIDVIMHWIQSMVNDCDSLQGFLLYRGSGGGTGSGLASLILERLAQEYPKCDVIEFSISSGGRLTPNILEPYNTAMTLHQSLEYTSAAFIIDNEACYDICDQFLNVSSPSYTNINRLLGQVISNVTASFRFEGSVNVDFKDLKTNLIPFPRIQYPIISYAPLTSKKQASFENKTEAALLHRCFHSSSQFVKCDTKRAQYMACTILFRGDVSNSSVNASIASIKAKKTIRFVDWCPTGFKVGVTKKPPVSVPGGDIAEVNRTCLMLANSTAIQSVWAKLIRKFDLLYSKKAFVHWYISEGFEQGDFEETRLDLAALESDYHDIASEK